MTNNKEIKGSIITEFYTVSGNFDLAYDSEVIIESFIELRNANEFAKEMKEEFIKRIPCDGALDLEETYEENEDFFYFKGVSADGENYVTVNVTKKSFKDWQGL